MDISVKFTLTSVLAMVIGMMVIVVLSVDDDTSERTMVVGCALTGLALGCAIAGALWVIWSH